MNCNSVVLLGRLVRRPQLRYAPGGKPTCTFQIAVNRPVAQTISPAHMENREEQDLYVDYPWITVSEDQAEICFQKLHSGSMVLIHDAQVRTYRYVEKPRKEIKFCGHCGTALEGTEPTEVTSKKFVVCPGCKEEVTLERTRLVTNIRTQEVEFISDNEEARIRKRLLEELRESGRLLPENHKDKPVGDKGLVTLPSNQPQNNRQQNSQQHSNQRQNPNNQGNRQSGHNNRNHRNNRNRNNQNQQQRASQTSAAK